MSRERLLSLGDVRAKKSAPVDKILLEFPARLSRIPLLPHSARVGETRAKFLTSTVL